MFFHVYSDIIRESIMTSINNNYQINQIEQPLNNPTSNATTSGNTSNVPLVDSKRQEVCKRLGIDLDTLNSILASNPEFLNLPLEKQTEILTSYKEKIAQPAQNEPEQTVAQESSEQVETFDYKNYETLSNEEKTFVYLTELAKNKFLYGNPPKTQKDWEALSEAEKQNLISVAKEEFSKNTEAKNEKDESYSLQWKMSKLQTANYLNMSAEEFEQQPIEYKLDAVHDYTVNLDEKVLSEAQKKYLAHQQEISSVIVTKCKEKGIECGNSTMSPMEIKQRCKELGTNPVEIEKEYLQGLKTQGKKLTDQQENRLKKLTGLSEFTKALQDMPQKDYGRLKTLYNTKYGEMLDACSSTEDKCRIVYQYAQETFNSLPDEEKRKAYLELASELVNNDVELATKLHEFTIVDASKETRQAIIKDDTELNQALNAYNINIFSEDEAAQMAEHQKEISKTDAKKGDILASITLSNADEGHVVATCHSYSRWPSENVGKKLVQIGYDKNRVGAESQKLILTDVLRNNSSESVLIEVGINVDKAYKENQVALTQLAIQNKNVNNAMIENGTCSRCADENQLEIFNLQKQRCEQSDYTREETIQNLQTLSDNIACCAKENQLAMHNEIMTSQYTEVQEYAAGNIKYYDPSVQAAAINTVYATGNQKAIETAIVNLAEGNFASGVQEQVLGSILNTAISSENSEKLEQIKEKIVTGNTLTQQEWHSLTSKEKTEYQAAYFKALTPAKQLKLLANISDPSLKKSIYKKLASQNKQMLENLIASDADTAKFIYDMGIANEIVINICKQKAPSEIKFKKLLETIEKNEQQKNGQQITSALKVENPITARTVNYASIPLNPNNNDNKFAIFKKDADGHILA